MRAQGVDEHPVAPRPVLPDRLPRTERDRQIAPRDAGPIPVDDPVHDLTMITERAPMAPLTGRRQRHDLLPPGGSSVATITRDRRNPPDVSVQPSSTAGIARPLQESPATVSALPRTVTRQYPCRGVETWRRWASPMATAPSVLPVSVMRPWWEGTRPRVRSAAPGSDGEDHRSTALASGAAQVRKVPCPSGSSPGMPRGGAAGLEPRRSMLPR